jgi:hypothetical protein
MAGENLVGRRVYHADSGHVGTIVKVNLGIPTPTARFHHDGTPLADANCVNLEKLTLLKPGDPGYEPHDEATA